MIQRRHHNQITRIKYFDGNCLTKHKDIERELTSHFHNLLSEPQRDCRTTVQKITQHIPQLVSPEQNQILMHPTSLEEFEQALFDIPKNKSPSPQGFTMNIFQACWPIIKWDVWEVV
jgi:mannosylglycoprotein endo-beta-mannosidase